jgi:ribA/ribD-fused uncharacterized protein
MYQVHFQLQSGGTRWSCTETPYQRAKFRDPEIREKFHGLNGYEAKKLARFHSDAIRPDWNDIKLHVMQGLLDVKFSNQTPLTRALCSELLATEDCELVEINTWGDTYWGVCKGVGENHLGKLLMAKRQTLRETLP